MNQRNNNHNKQPFTRIMRKPSPETTSPDGQAPRIIKRKFNTADRSFSPRPPRGPFNTKKGSSLPVPENSSALRTRPMKAMRRPARMAPLPAKKAPDEIPPLAPGDIRIIPIGGVEEITKNMTAIEY